MSTLRIMVAQTSEALPLTAESLQGYDLIQVTEMRQAEKQIVNDDIDLFVLGIHFDDSRAVELVSLIRNNEKYKSAPVIMVRVMATPLADLLRSTVNGLVKIGSVERYLELEGLSDATQVLREAVEGSLAKSRRIA